MSLFLSLTIRGSFPLEIHVCVNRVFFSCAFYVSKNWDWDSLGMGMAPAPAMTMEPPQPDGNGVRITSDVFWLPFRWLTALKHEMRT